MDEYRIIYKYVYVFLNYDIGLIKRKIMAEMNLETFEELTGKWVHI